MSAHPNVFEGRALIWACRWIKDFDARKYSVCIHVCGFDYALKDAVIDDFGNLVEVQ